MFFTIDGNPIPVVDKYWWITGELIPRIVDYIDINEESFNHGFDLGLKRYFLVLKN